MSKEKSLESRGPEKVKTISPEAAEWGEMFFKHLDIAYADLISELPTEATELDFRQAMMIAIGIVFEDSGANPDQIVQLWEETLSRRSSRDGDATWSHEKNARRFQLIDKQIQQTITPGESVELAQLTSQMRVHCDTEAMVPLEGARQLHRQLLEMDDSQDR